MDATVNFDVNAHQTNHAMPPYNLSLYTQLPFPCKPDVWESESQERELQLDVPLDAIPSAPPLLKASSLPLAPSSLPPPPPPPPSQPHFSFQKHFSRKCTYIPPKNLSESCNLNEIAKKWDEVFFEGYGADVLIFTKDACFIKAHSNVLVATSPVFRHLIYESKCFPHKIPIPGVPFDAAKVFVRYLYSGRCEADDWKEYVLHLLTLSHVFSIPSLKQKCVWVLEQEGFLNEENVLDALLLARLCDVPRLNLICIRVIVKKIEVVIRSEAWEVMCQSSPLLELELVEAVIENEFKEKESIFRNREAKAYKQIFDAVEALDHICKDGCGATSSGSQKEPCNYPACKGIESLVRHFSCCKYKASGGCTDCKRMWQLLELHSRLCKESKTCKVPLCRHFKEKVGHDLNSKGGAKWNTVIRKVLMAQKGVCGIRGFNHSQLLSWVN